MQEATYLKEVREQYENYPYPYRNPEDEKRRIIFGSIDSLAKINHFCFQGKCDFMGSFRVLVAGGGTGDATVFLAEQLRYTDAQIVYLDLSTASMDIAKQRVQVRGLNNVEFVQGSLLDVENLGLGEFDYINCTGVLHHLTVPEEGLKSLKGVLKEGGAMGIMIYGKYGRTGVYQMQELMRRINNDEPNMQVRTDNTKSILTCLPDTNWFKRSESTFLKPVPPKTHSPNLSDRYSEDNNIDIEVYDLLLHSQDRPYTVSDVYDLVESAELNFVCFEGNGALYRPESFIPPSPVLDKIQAFSTKEQQAIAELISGHLYQHFFYVSNQTNTIANPMDLENLPFFYMPVDSKQFYQATMNIPIGSQLEIACQFKEAGKLHIGPFTKYLFKYIDGRHSLRECFDLIKGDPDLKGQRVSDEDLYQDFKNIYDLFNLMDLMVLRHRSVPEFRISFEQLQGPLSRQ